jgi:hypothetical protein
VCLSFPSLSLSGAMSSLALCVRDIVSARP